LNTTASLVTNKLTVGGSSASLDTSPLLYIVDGASLTIGNEFQVGDSSSKRGRVIQTGGTVVIGGGTYNKLEVGYKSTAGYGGYYTISGGSISGASAGKLYVGGGGAIGSEGVFTIQGSAATIDVAYLYVGCSSSTGTYAGSGTIAYEVGASGVTAISAGSVYIDPVADSASIATLLVSMTSTNPVGDILLINNTGTVAVHGVFDTLNGGSAIEGATVVLGGVTYTLTYVYTAGTDGVANDVALVAPEPATIALLSLGLLAIRRKK